MTTLARTCETCRFALSDAKSRLFCGARERTYWVLTAERSEMGACGPDGKLWEKRRP